jgi:hypothetical protein
MQVKKSRCFSGPPTHLGYPVADLEAAKKLFFWYSLGRAFAQRQYPMWVDAEAMWGPNVPSSLQVATYATAFAIAYAENECVEVRFPANNPIQGAPELHVRNPMTPNNQESFWSQVLAPYVGRCATPHVVALIHSVDAVFDAWKTLFVVHPELSVSHEKPYFIGDGYLTKNAGLLQIRDYATETSDARLLEMLETVAASLRVVKDEFLHLVISQLDYFGDASLVPSKLELPSRTRFEKALCRRLAVAGLLVDRLQNDPNFGRTKLAKVFYLADAHEALDLETSYVRETAGPLDARSFYNPQFGIEGLAQKHGIFETSQLKTRAAKDIYKYKCTLPSEKLREFADQHLGQKATRVVKIADDCSALSTDQSEIIATLYACWNDFLLKRRSPTDDEIVTEFLYHWHHKKSRFSRTRLMSALKWMRSKKLIPQGRGKATTLPRSNWDH